MMPMMNVNRNDAMLEWEQLSRQISAQAEQIIQAQTKLDLLYTMNGLGDRITGTEPETIVAGGTMEREQALAVGEMLVAFKAWAATPLPKSGTTPLQIIFRR